MKNTMIIDETINWNKVQNNMTQTQADAPYLGVVQAKGTVTFAALVTGVKNDGCSESELEIIRVMTKQAELLKSYVAQNYKVYFPFGIAGVHLTKSFPSQDAPFDPRVNEAIMSILTNAETRNCLDGVTLKEDTSAAAALKGPKINFVCTDGTRFGVVVCYQPFSVAGSGLLLDPSKSTDKLTLTSEKTGAVTDVTDYTCDGEGFRVDAQVNASLTPGKYTLTAYVDTGDAEHPNVHEATSKVTVEAGQPPEPPKKVVSIDALTVDRESESIAIAVTHPEGTSEYSASGEFELVKVKLGAGGEEVSTFFGRNKGSDVPFSVSEWPTGLPKEGKLTVILTPDPDKADEYDQTPAVKTEA